jgi:thiamine-monophosphate kinase
LDVSRVATESRVGVTLDEEQVRACSGSTLHAAAAALSLDPLDLALYGGEDYALVMTFAPGALAPGFVAIGTCTVEPDVVLRMADGTRRKLDTRGYDHCARCRARRKARCERGANYGDV